MGARWLFDGSRQFCSVFCLAALLLTAGCGDDDGVTSPLNECRNCDSWTRITDGMTDSLGSFPSYYPDPADERRTIAFSSDRGNDENIENIWVMIRGEDGGVDRYVQITDSPTDDFDPAWSPDGTRIAFTRASEERFDIYVLDVQDFDNPGGEVRMTSEHPLPSDSVALPFRPSSPFWLDDDEILFSNGVDIFIAVLDEGNAPTAIAKVVDDPSDYVLSEEDDFAENQPTGIRIGGVDRIYFVSGSRVPLGAISVVATELGTGGEVHAEIHLEGVPTGVETPNVVGGRPLGTYQVGAKVTDPEAEPEEKFCDTLLTERINVFENDTASVMFEFDNPRGAILLIARPRNSKLFFDGRKKANIAADTTTIGCVFPGTDHVVKIESIDPRLFDIEQGKGLQDSACVRLAQKETAFVFLDVSALELAGSSDTLCNPNAARAFVQDDWWQKEPRVQDPSPLLWHYDTGTGSYRVLSSRGVIPAYPAISPDGRFLAYVVDFQGLDILSLEDGRLWTVPLPGERGINICSREVGFPAWSPDGKRIAVAMSPCTDRPSSDHNASELHLWEVDLERLLNLP